MGFEFQIDSNFSIKGSNCHRLRSSVKDIPKIVPLMMAILSVDYVNWDD